jgi:hypothetical protein
MNRRELLEVATAVGLTTMSAAAAAPAMHEHAAMNAKYTVLVAATS